MPKHLACKSLPGSFAWEPLLGKLAWEPVLGNLSLETYSGEPCLETCSWKPVLGNLWESLGPWETFSWELVGNLWESLRIFSIFGNLWESWEPGLRTLLGNLFLGTLGASGGNHAREPCLGTFENLFLGTFGNLAWEPLPGNLCEPCLGILLGNLAREPCLGTLLGNVFLGTLGNLAWDGPGFAPGNFSPSAFFFRRQCRINSLAICSMLNLEAAISTVFATVGTTSTVIAAFLELGADGKSQAFWS